MNRNVNTCYVIPAGSLPTGWESLLWKAYFPCSAWASLAVIIILPLSQWSLSILGERIWYRHSIQYGAFHCLFCSAPWSPVSLCVSPPQLQMAIFFRVLRDALVYGHMSKLIRVGLTIYWLRRIIVLISKLQPKTCLVTGLGLAQWGCQVLFSSYGTGFQWNPKMVSYTHDTWACITPEGVCCQSCHCCSS